MYYTYIIIKYNLYIIMFEGIKNMFPGGESPEQHKKDIAGIADNPGISPKEKILKGEELGITKDEMLEALQQRGVAEVTIGHVPHIEIKDVKEENNDQ